MELLKGEPLDKRIERLGQLALQDTARILQQVCRGARARARARHHPSRSEAREHLPRPHADDDEEIAKVLDFGIAKIQNSPHSAGITSSTKTGAVLGTPFYMSPEQARGSATSITAPTSGRSASSRSSASPGGSRSTASRSAICS